MSHVINGPKPKAQSSEERQKRILSETFYPDINCSSEIVKAITGYFPQRAVCLKYVTSRKIYDLHEILEFFKIPYNYSENTVC